MKATTPEQIAASNGRIFAAALKRKPTPRTEVETLRLQAFTALRGLRELARTDSAAANTLASLLFNAVRELAAETLVAGSPLRCVARRSKLWPALVSVDREIQASQTAFAADVGLGAEYPRNFKGRQAKRTTPETRAALKLFGVLRNHKTKLPPFNRKSAPAWWKAARPLFPKVFGERFEQHVLFSSYDTATNRTRAENAGLNFHTWKRAAILNKMPQAFVSIAPKV